MQSVIIHFALFSNDKRDKSFLDIFYALKPKVPVAFEKPFSVIWIFEY